MRKEPTIYDIMTQDLKTIEPGRRYGKTMLPIPATAVYRRVISTLMRDGIRVEKWILINQRDNKVTSVMTYNGIAGAHFDAQRNTQLLSWELLQPKLENFRYVPTDECPVAAPVSRASLQQKNSKVA